MNLSRFVGATNREALRQVRLALGPDALIVSNRRINGGVEIMASDPTPDPAGLAPPRPESRADQAPQDVMGAIAAMRGALEARLDEATWGSQLRQMPRAARLFHQLLGMGFSTALLRALLRRLPAGMTSGAAMRWVRDELARHLPVLAREDDFWKPGLVLALLGPTGVGKTTTVAKLAARGVKRFGADGVMLVTTDTYRVGAHEQLKLYGDMLRVPSCVVGGADELRRALDAAGPDRVVLIDSTGVSQRSRRVAEQTAMLAAAGRPVTRLLVLNAASHGDTLDEVARAYAGTREMAGCIVTKVDEASRVAPVLDTAIRYRLPVHYLSDGQRVPQDLRSCAPGELVDLALTRNVGARDLYAPTEADFAALMALAGGAAKPRGQSTSRRIRLLPRLLAREDGGHLSVEALRQTCEAVEETPACMEAFELWRAWAGDASPADAAASSRHLLRRAVDAAAAARAPLAILHGRARLEPPEPLRTELYAAVALDVAGGGLTVPALQLALAGSWQPIWGSPALAVPRASTALLQRMDWLDRGGMGVGLIHVLRGMTPSLARALADAGQAWLAACPARTSVVSDGCAGPMSALAATLEFRPLSECVAAPVGAGAPSGTARPSAWVAHAPVGLSRRAGVSPVVAAILVRDGPGGSARTLYGLADARALDVGVERLAGLLRAAAGAHDVFRHMRACWHLLTRTEPKAPPTLHKALVAAQMGVAVGRAARDEALAPALRGLAPARTVTPAALSRLFTLKEMLERDETAVA